MKKGSWLVLCLVLATAILLASCSTSPTSAPPTSNATSTTTTPPGGETVLTVTEGSKVNNFSLMDLQALTSATGNGGYMSQSGTITGPFSYQGVALANLLNTVGGISEGDSVVFTSSDNHSETLSYDQITKSNFNYYDTSGNRITPQTMPTLTLIYSENGTLLDNTDGPVELGMLSSQNILTDGSLWAKMVTTITVIPAINGLNSTSARSTNGLDLSLSLDSATYHPGEEVAITIDEKNALSTHNSVITADKWPVNGLGVGPCGVLNYPFGVAIFQGSYTSADISSAVPLQIYQPGEYLCPMILAGISSYIFQPLSDSAAVFQMSESTAVFTLEMNTEFEPAPTGYWASNNFNAAFTDFEPGVYTVAAGDEWGTLVIVHFTVSN